MLGSCPISSIRLIALEALTPILSACFCSASIASFAALRIFLGVVLSFVTSLRTARACFMRDSYSSFRFAFCKPHHQDSVGAPRIVKVQEGHRRTSRLKDFRSLLRPNNPLGIVCTAE